MPTQRHNSHRPSRATQRRAAINITQKLGLLLKRKAHRRWLGVTVVAIFFGIGLVTSAISNAATVSSGSVSKGKSLLKPAKSFKTRKNLRYSSASDRLTLDLYTPNNSAKRVPLIIYVHGGGFVLGSKDQGCQPYVKNFMQRGFAVACINYRLITEAQLPAAVIDVKSAIRTLRANATKFKIYPTKIGAWGDSAGGYLVAMAGTSAKVKKFEKGPNLKASSAVQAVVDDYGPMDLAKLTKETKDNNIKALGAVLGGSIVGSPQKTAELNPVTYVSGDEPPFLIRHGDKDGVVPINQSQMLHSALKKKGEVTQLATFKGGGHGGGDFQSQASYDTIAKFFDKHLRP